MLKIPFGLRKSDGRMVEPGEVARGLACGCICAGCKRPLIANQGEIKRPYFSHSAESDCANAVESAIHRMAKQLILERQEIWLPGLKLEQLVVGPTAYGQALPSWQETVCVAVQDEGLTPLQGCREEQEYAGRRPDILASTESGMLIAIEVANTHFSDDEKRQWMAENNLTTLEIDLQISPEIPTDGVRGELERRLFEASHYGTWLHHARHASAAKELGQLVQAVRAKYADRDAAFRAQEEKALAARERKAKFKQSIAVIEWEDVWLSPDLTLRVAYSAARCTVKGRGYFAGADPAHKKAISDAGKKFGGVFNGRFHVWVFNRPPEKVKECYEQLLAYFHEVFASGKWKPGPTKENFSLMGLDEFEQEDFHEIAGKLQFEQGCSQQDAEGIAFRTVLARRTQNGR